MPFQLSVYRAAEGLGPMTEWGKEHREPLGTRDEVQAAVDQVFPDLCWEEYNGFLFASTHPDDDHGFEITLHGERTDKLLDISIYSFPPAVRRLMSGLNLNYCFAPESGELYFPFKAGDRWPGAARHNSDGSE